MDVERALEALPEDLLHRYARGDSLFDLITRAGCRRQTQGSHVVGNLKQTWDQQWHPADERRGRPQVFEEGPNPDWKWGAIAVLPPVLHVGLAEDAEQVV